MTDLEAENALLREALGALMVNQKSCSVYPAMQFQKWADLRDAALSPPSVSEQSAQPWMCRPRGRLTLGNANTADCDWPSCHCKQNAPPSASEQPPVNGSPDAWRG